MRGKRGVSLNPGLVVGRRKGRTPNAVMSALLSILVSAQAFAFTATLAAGDSVAASQETKQDVLGSYASIGGYFTENRGQVKEQVLFYSRGNPSVAFRNDGVMFLASEARQSGGLDGETGVRSHLPIPASSQRVDIRSIAYIVRFEGANDVVPEGRNRLPFNSNYFVGNDSSRWETNVPNYREVVYRNVYDGIDLVYRARSGGVKYEFVVSPGADPGLIRLSYDGVDAMRMEDGSISASTLLGNILDSRPYSYQSGGGEVNCGFVARASSSYGFGCDQWVRSEPLIIDPLVYSTFLGGSDNNEWCTPGLGDEGASIAVDGGGNAYVFGNTCSTDFPVTPGAFNTTYWIKGRPHLIVPPECPDWCVDPRQTFVAKLNPEGTMLLYATYLGGEGMELASSIAVDSSGNAYLTGVTLSAGLQPGTKGYPVTAGAFDTSFGVFYLNRSCWCCSVYFSEAFVTKLNPTGSALVYSTFLGTTGNEWAYSIAIDSSGYAYVTGETNSSLFPVTAGAFDTTYNGGGLFPDVFVSKLNQAGSALVYSTFLGGLGYEWGSSIAVDSGGNAYVTGDTNSTAFPLTPGVYDTTLNGLLDVFVTRLNATGKKLDFSTLLGGSELEWLASIAVDSSRNVYVAGSTRSPDFPTTAGAFRRVFIGREGFVTKFNPTATSLVYSTFIGGNSDTDTVMSLALDSFGDAFVSGQTYSGDFPVTKDAFDTVFSDREGFVTKFNADGSGLLYSTFLGGTNDEDRATSIVVDTSGLPYATGYTNSPDYPTTANAFDRTFNNVTDAFVFKLVPQVVNDPPDLLLLPSDITFVPPSPGTVGVPVDITAKIHNMGGTNATLVTVRFHDGPPSGPNQIGVDQIIPFIHYFGEADTSVAWTPATQGTHDICVVADPDMKIAELNEGNNQACAQFEVLPRMPDLHVLPSDLVLTPAQPYIEGDMVHVTATIWNIGTDTSSTTAARFHDGVPPSTQIGTDQTLGPLPVGGKQSVSTDWIASPVGPHMICVVADPANVIAELDETNNLACVRAGVRPPPDLIPLLVSIDPPSPLLDGTTATVTATVLNAGDSATGPFDVVLFNDVNINFLPDAGETIGVSSLSTLNGHAQAYPSFSWIATPVGTHNLCAYADPPPGRVNESVETNNVACTTVIVQAPPSTMPDYVPASPLPGGTVRVGLLTPVDLSVQVLNQGDATAPTDATLAFYDEATPTIPFVTFGVAPLNPSETSLRFTGTWISPVTPGTYHIIADVDYGNAFPEWNEANNTYAWTVEVVGGPITSFVIGNPNYTLAVTYVSPLTLLGFSTVDQSGAGIRNTTYRIDSGLWVNYTATGPFALSGEGEHNLEWRSVDFAGNVESISQAILRLDGTPPVTTLNIGNPSYMIGGNFVNSSTPLALQTVDGGATPVGVNSTTYSIDGGAWNVYSTTLHLTVEGAHSIEFLSTDLLQNGEAQKTISIIVDNTPPATSVDLAVPNYVSANTYVSSLTQITLRGEDGGVTPVGLDFVEYRIDGGGWDLYTIPFNLVGIDGIKTIEFTSKDRLGNVENARNRTFFLDNAPPVTSVSPDSGDFTTDTLFSLNATDGGSGVKYGEYKVDDGLWITYLDGFSLPRGKHNIYYRSVDNVNNREAEHRFAVDVGYATTEPPAPAANYKPLLAMFFSILLLVAGMLSSARRPWKGESGGKAALIAFTVTALPFISAEVTTGIVSHLSGELSIPPTIGIGTAVDLAIFICGIAVATWWALKNEDLRKTAT